MTRDEIIKQVLEDRRELGLYEIAIDRLNLILERIYKAHEWKFLIKKATTDLSFAAGADSSTLPSDFYRHYIARLVIPNTSPQAYLPLTWQPINEFLLRAIDAGQSTQPEFYTITPEPAEGSITSKILVYPAFSEARSIQLWYYHLPAKLLDNSKPLFPDHSYLVQCLDNAIKYYQNPMSAQTIDKFISGTIEQVKQNLFIGGVQGQQAPLDPKFFKRRR